MYIKVQRAVKIPHTSAPAVLGTLTAAAPGPEWVLRVCVSLKHFRPMESLGDRLFGLARSSSCWTGLLKKKKSLSSHLVCLLSSLCCVAPSEPRSPFCCIFAVSRVAPFCCFKTGDVFMSLIRVPLTKVTSSHVGTVCRVTNIPQCVVLFACDRGRKWTPASECQKQIWASAAGNFIHRSFCQHNKLLKSSCISKKKTSLVKMSQRVCLISHCGWWRQFISCPACDNCGLCFHTV